MNKMDIEDTMSSMKVAVMGGGNASHTIAADLTLKGLTVNMFEMEKFAQAMKTVFETREIEMSGVAGTGKARLNLVTSDIREAIAGVEIIFIPLPGFAVTPYAKILAPYLEEDQIVLIIPGTLGALEFRWMLWSSGCQKNVIVGETGGMPFAARVIAPGQVKTFHVRAIVALATIPGNKGNLVYDKVKGLYPFALRKTVIEPAFGHLTPLLHPLGSILNAGRIERSHGEFYIYEEGMTPSVVKVIEEMDRERLEIGEKLGIQFPTGVEMMVESKYGPQGTLWESLNGSAGLTPVKGPTSLESRYITEDIPYSLVAWASIGHLAGVNTPIMDAVINIGSAIMGINCWEEGRNLKKMGLEGLTLEQTLVYLEDGKHPKLGEKNV
jgi:opine dehydrogenase